MIWPCNKKVRHRKDNSTRHSEGFAKPGRLSKRWACNSKDWTGLRLGDSQTAAEDRQKWRNLVAASSTNGPTTTRSRER